MDKPCKDCYQTVNIYGIPLLKLVYPLPQVRDHVSRGNIGAHSTCVPDRCSAHEPISDLFEAYVLRTLKEVESGHV